MGMVFYFIQTACVLTVLAYILARTKFFSSEGTMSKSTRIKTLLTVILFTFVSLYGVVMQQSVDTVMHIDTRIAGIALAGFLFGGNISLWVFLPSALVSVVLNEVTLWADLIAMGITCLVSSTIYKYFNKNDAVLHGIVVGCMEIIHMLLIVCMVRPLETAKDIVYSVSFPMIVVNGLAVISFVSIINDINERRDLWEKESFTKSSFDIAGKIQQSLLRTDFHLDSRLDLYAFLQPALDVGGDLYSFLLDDQRYFKFIIGDVSGKGVPASIVMSRTETLFSELALRYSDPAEIMTILNKRLSENNKAMMFVTACIGVLDITTGELLYANAGHVQPYIVEKGQKTIEPERPQGKPLGIKSKGTYVSTKIQLTPGQVFVSYTDGITEAESLSLDLYGKDRLVNCLDAVLNTTSQGILEEVLNDVKSFAWGAKQSDDICIFGFGVKNDFLQYEMENKTESFIQVAQKVNADLKSYLVNGETLTQRWNDNVALVVEEIISNVIQYGYPDKKNDTIQLFVYPKTKTVVIEDHSIAYDPFENTSPNVSVDPKKRDIGGMGIFLTKNRVVSHTYESHEGVNTLTLVIEDSEVKS